MSLARKAREANAPSNLTKAAEIELAVTVLCHSAIRTVDYFNSFLQKYGENSTISKVKLHRTKCAAVIKNIVAPSFKAEMLDELRDKPFTLLIDESTDVGTTKLLCVCVRYVSLKKKEICT
ncbi:Zinc finger mym-type protein 1 [Plakobranchus ocellatus]|uniref:Zinc finger mym-type protein 1 n=1 Tax=Plakobranchus ocellatus TaxID=259542 RepID=A0AAV3YX57_9GAST|nr:Zinc finger mym-type protein 1 [Plakobranchus ocellatus]